MPRHLSKAGSRHALSTWPHGIPFTSANLHLQDWRHDRHLLCESLSAHEKKWLTPWQVLGEGVAKSRKEVELSRTRTGV